MSFFVSLTKSSKFVHTQPKRIWESNLNEYGKFIEDVTNPGERPREVRCNGHESVRCRGNVPVGYVGRVPEVWGSNPAEAF
jgi:hypothetical protein